MRIRARSVGADTLAARRTHRLAEATAHENKRHVTDPPIVISGLVASRQADVGWLSIVARGDECWFWLDAEARGEGAQGGWFYAWTALRRQVSIASCMSPRQRCRRRRRRRMAS
jgi:hypothetical protein